MSQPDIAIIEAANNSGGYFTCIDTGSHKVFADEPFAFGGMDKAPSPTDYLCVALASCKAITLRMYAERKMWQVEEIKINVKMVKGTEGKAALNTFFCEVDLQGNLTIAQKERMLQISKACPVQKLLCTNNEIVSVLI